MAYEGQVPSSTQHTIELPDSGQVVRFEVDYIPTEALPGDFAEYTSNAAHVTIGGKDFTVVMGKTVTETGLT